MIWRARQAVRARQAGGDPPRGRRLPLISPCVSVCMSRASSTGSTDDTSVEMMAASRPHMAPKHLRSSSRRDARCSWRETPCAQCPEAPRLPGASTPRPHASHTPFGNRPPRPGQTQTHFSCTFSCKLQGRRQSAGRRKRDRLSGSRAVTGEGAEYTQGRLLSPGGRTPVGPHPAPGCAAAPPGSSG